MAVVLQITPHHVFPPRGGRRAFFFLREMAREHRVVAIFPQTLASLQGTREGYTFPINVELLSPLETPPPRTVFDWLPSKIGQALKYRWLRRSWRGPAESTILETWHLIATAFRKTRADVIIFDHIQTMAGCAWYARRLAPNAVLTLNAHNVDSELYAQQLTNLGGKDKHNLLDRTCQTTRWLETHLADYVGAFWACSEVDKQKLDKMNHGTIRGFAVPNGIAVELLPFDENPAKRSLNEILFCGALNHSPNRNGLEWFHKNIWPLIRARHGQLRLRIVGYGAAPEEFRAIRQDPSVDFVGEVDNVVPHYHQTSLSVAPLLEGSGTRVKILEAMSLGSPVVSTTIGAEGIEAKPGREILLADEPAEFAAAVTRLMAEQQMFESIRRAGRRLVEQKYDWRAIGESLNNIIRSLASTHRS